MGDLHPALAALSNPLVVPEVGNPLASRPQEGIGLPGVWMGSSAVEQLGQKPGMSQVQILPRPLTDNQHPITGPYFKLHDRGMRCLDGVAKQDWPTPPSVRPAH